ncbi:MAG: hypothetical protein HC794_09470 [Nitrospiraceae bacterium]|nr:hypothetical protein [Nitrospiraceae bacterium]
MENVVTRFPFGLTNVGETNILSDMGQLDPTKFHTFWDDFDSYVVTDGTNVQWTVTAASTGTVAQAAGNGGLLLLTAANTDEDLIQLQRTIAAFRPVVGKRTFFKARLMLSAAALTDLLIGISNIDTSLIAASVIGTTDFIGFFKAATDTSLTLFCRQDATTGSTSVGSIGTVANATMFTVGFYFDGVDKIFYSFNDVVLGRLAVSSSFLPNLDVSPSIAIAQEGTGGAGTATAGSACPCCCPGAGSTSRSPTSSRFGWCFNQAERQSR